MSAQYPGSLRVSSSALAELGESDLRDGQVTAWASACGCCRVIDDMNIRFMLNEEQNRKVQGWMRTNAAD
jgi:hypothetical protein